MWAEHGAAAGPDGRAAGAGAGATGALLAPGLGAAAGDQTTGFGGRRSASARGLLGTHALVHQRFVPTGGERVILAA